MSSLQCSIPKSSQRKERLLLMLYAAWIVCLKVILNLSSVNFLFHLDWLYWITMNYYIGLCTISRCSGFKRKRRKHGNVHRNGIFGWTCLLPLIRFFFHDEGAWFAPTFFFFIFYFLSCFSELFLKIIYSFFMFKRFLRLRSQVLI